MHANLDCQNHVQRLQGMDIAFMSSGSRRGDPGTLRSWRTLDVHNTHNRLTGKFATQCSRPCPCERKPEAKTAAFFLQKTEVNQPVAKASERKTSGGRALSLFCAIWLEARAEHLPPFPTLHPP
jgi:uncharacterized protein YfaQ (DUF2300 family)